MSPVSTKTMEAIPVAEVESSEDDYASKLDLEKVV
jgi:hypothetical protein